MIWLNNKNHQLYFSISPRICSIKDGWIIQLFTDELRTLEIPIFEKEINIKKDYKILIKEQTGDNRLKLLYTNDIKRGDIIKIDFNVPKKIDFITYFEIIDIIPETNEIILNRKIFYEVKMKFIKKSNLTGIYYFNFTPDKPGKYIFQISNPKYLIKPFGYTIEVKEKLLLQELFELYTSKLKKKFSIKSSDPREKIEGIKDPIWFNKTTGKVWVWNGEKWVTADK